MSAPTVLMDLTRFRLIKRNGLSVLQVRSGRLTGLDLWYTAYELGEYMGFVAELGRLLEKPK